MGGVPMSFNIFFGTQQFLLSLINIKKYYILLWINMEWMYIYIIISNYLIQSIFSSRILHVVIICTYLHCEMNNIILLCFTICSCSLLFSSYQFHNTLSARSKALGPFCFLSFSTTGMSSTIFTYMIRQYAKILYDIIMWFT